MTMPAMAPAAAEPHRLPTLGSGQSPSAGGGSGACASGEVLSSGGCASSRPVGAGRRRSAAGVCEGAEREGTWGLGWEAVPRLEQ